ncbi:MAG TPA: ABC transporter substrate-binding protein [Candidatus Limnocylindria bacterium]|nr:ABC transporter substrate-binding protein [Candidatus Limnocylindria bacterium]
MFRKNSGVLVILVLTLLAAAAQASSPVTLTDTLGREVAIEAPVRRIVALQPSDVEILFAIGAGDLLVGRGQYCDYPAEALAIPSVQSGFETNIEQIIALRPDLLIMTTMNQRPEDAEKLSEAGIPVLVTQAETIAEVYGVIRLLGQAVQREDEAATLDAGMRAAFAEIAEKAEGREGASAYYEVSPLEYGLWAAGAGTFMDEIGAMVNLRNVFGDVEGFAAVSEEQVLARDPDVIVTTAMYFGMGLPPKEEVMARAGWQGVAAVREGRVFNASADAITRPGPRLTQAAEELYDFLYGAAER